MTSEGDESGLLYSWTRGRVVRCAEATNARQVLCAWARACVCVRAPSAYRRQGGYVVIVVCLSVKPPFNVKMKLFEKNISDPRRRHRSTFLIMAALRSRCGHYILILCFLLSFFFFFHHLISAVGDWMSTILPHMVWP